MKESTGSVASIYIIIFFIVILFGFITSIMSYYKAYKINNSLTGTIDDYGGFNEQSMEDIENKLTTYGYNRRNINCKARDNAKIVDIVDGKYQTYEGDATPKGYKGYCVYLVDETGNKEDTAYTYYSYQIITYFTIDFPIVNDILKLPISTKTSTMYSCYGQNCSKEES